MNLEEEIGEREGPRITPKVCGPSNWRFDVKLQSFIIIIKFEMPIR